METKLLKLKSVLQEHKNDSQNNMYDHLKNCIHLFLQTQPQQCPGLLETLSSQTKLIKNNLLLNEVAENPVNIATAQIENKLVLLADGEDNLILDRNFISPVQDLKGISFFFNQCGVGLSEGETIILNLGFKLLITKFPNAQIRFWGKIFGQIQNYYIVECDLQTGESFDDFGTYDEVEENEKLDEMLDEMLDENESEEVELPKSNWKNLPKVDPEPFGEGTNKKIYFICHSPLSRWIRLPNIKPEHIVAARQIYKMFTGNLDAPVNTYPVFPGVEAHYLRAQIARISAGTHVSPMGYYNFEMDEEGDEEFDDTESEVRQTFEQNMEYEPLPIEQLALPSLRNWVHHVSYILPQGRVKWFNQIDYLDEDDMSVESSYNSELEDNEDYKKTRLGLALASVERGPPILTPISNDLAVWGQAPWSVRTFLVNQSANASVCISSSLWPGAHALAWGKSFENIYVGWGLKAVGPGFDPPKHPAVMAESDENLQEMLDPTPEEERDALEEKDSDNEEGDDDGSDVEDDDDDDNI